MTGEGNLKQGVNTNFKTFNFLSKFNIWPHRGFSLIICDTLDSRRSIHGQGDFETQNLSRSQ